MSSIPLQESASAALTAGLRGQVASSCATEAGSARERGWTLCLATRPAILHLLLITTLGLLFFNQLVLNPTQVLCSDYSDLLAEHIPAKRFLVRSWQETGEVPLWCPYLFSGMPIISDIQVAAFYPPHFILYLLSEEWVGVAVSWLIVFHVIAAGWCMYAYTRRHLQPLAALTAALGYMFAGRWMLHLLGGGHYITIGLAWLPLVLLFLEQAIQHGGLAWATWAGVFFGLLTLGCHPQWIFYAGLFVAIWTWQWSSRWLSYGGCCLLVAVGLAAVQLLPTLQAAAQSSRAAGVDTEEILRGGLRVLVFLVGPALSADPPILMWEDRGGLGLLWLVLVALAPTICRGRWRYQTWVCLGLFLFALGGAILFQFLPGFSLFRQPARVLIIAAFPVAFIAGAAFQALFLESGLTRDDWRWCRKKMLTIVVGVGILVGGLSLRIHFYNGKPLRFHLYWVTLLINVPLAYFLFFRPQQLRPALARSTWLAILLLDLWGVAWSLVSVRPETEVYAPSACVRYLMDQASATNGGRQPPDAATEGVPLTMPPPHYSPWRVLDRDQSEKSASTPLGTGAPLAIIWRLEAVRGYNPLDILRYKEYLQFITNKDNPLRPLEGPLMFPIVSDFPLVNKSLIDLLGVRYLLQPSNLRLPQEGWRAVFVDREPTAFNFIGGGIHTLRSYTVYENEQVLPRAFIVPHAEPMPPRHQLLTKLQQTDFRKVVLLETPRQADRHERALAKGSGEPTRASGRLQQNPPRSHGQQPPLAAQTAEIREYLPNRIVVQVDAGAPGYLVLTDLWYPGWECTLDGKPIEVYRANFLFRAVEIPEGSSQVIFTFNPASYRWGKWVSLLSLASVGIIFVGSPLLRKS